VNGSFLRAPDAGRSPGGPFVPIVPGQEIVMKQHRSRRILGFALGLAVVAAAAGAGAQIKKGKTRLAPTSHIMKGLVKPHCDAIKKGLEAAAIGDEGWQALAVDAALLNEASYLLMDDGRCPDKVWADAASKTFRDGSAALIKAIEGKDVARAKTAFGDMTKSCKGCHETHRNKK
jgi:cytochrome c556